MPDIHIGVTDKIATGDGSRIVCGNSDYTAVFSFDEEWAAYEVKTARFVYPGRPGDHIDVIFEGDTCPVPVLRNTIGVKVGVFAGDLHTTTSAWFDCKKSVLCESGGSPVEPEPDVYAQLMERLRDLEGGTPYAKHVDEVILPECSYDTDLDGCYIYGDYAFELVEGYVYDVVFNGTLYQCPATKPGNIVLLTGLTYTEDFDPVGKAPFSFFYPNLREYNGKMMCAGMLGPTPRTGTIAITGYTRVQKIDPMALPARPGVYVVEFQYYMDPETYDYSIIPLPDGDQAYKRLKNVVDAGRPIVAKLLSESGNLAGEYQLSYYSRPTWIFTRVDMLAPETPVLEVLRWDGSSVPATVTRTKVQPQITGEADQFVVIGEDGKPVAKNVEVGATGDYIPAPATAAVGQTIMVSEVDEDGKPTAWEAVERKNIDVDTTLSVAGSAADAKAVGNALAEKLGTSGGVVTGKIVFPVGDAKAGVSNSFDSKIFGYGLEGERVVFKVGDGSYPLWLNGSETTPKYNGAALLRDADVIKLCLPLSGGTMAGDIVFPTGDQNVGIVNSGDVKVIGYGGDYFRVGDISYPLQMRSSVRPKYNDYEIAIKNDIPSDDHIKKLINSALGVIENGTY